MGESSKQVRVDNWGTFFLQRLQLFFNKTDYCDLTLQFEGNEQLKVHRLVMNACTEYFQMLEQTYDTVDNVLIMPPDMQADVVVPIVNFMYTGMLEFQMSKYEKLYKTAELMNITVLTKLLDAQKQPILPTRQINKRNTHTSHSLDSPVRKALPKSSGAYLPPTLPGRKLPVWKRRVAPVPSTHPVSQQFYSEYKRPAHQPDPLALYDNTPKPTRFEWPDEDLTTFNLLDSSSSNFDDISYTSRPLLTQEDEMRTSTSFDEIKYSANVNKVTPKNYGTAAIDMEEVKNYMKEQKIRSDMTDYDDEEAADNDLETYVSSGQKELNTSGSKRKLENDISSATKRVRFSINEKENKETKINVTPMGKSATEMNHTKIISELLKKYPHLVKKNKNIRLKIMAKSNKSSSAESIKVPLNKASTSKLKVQVTQSRSTKSKSSKANVLDENDKKDGPWTCHRCSTPNDPVEFVLYYLYRKHMTDVHNEKFDSRMCKYCGHKSSKHNMLTYHLYTKHGVKPPPAYNFPKCSQCHYIALTEALLIKHKLNHTKFELQCPECKVAFSAQDSLANHMEVTGHTGKCGKTNYDCQYCTKRYQTGANLFSHIKMQHREEARRDGIVSIDEIEDTEEIDDNSEEQQVREEDRYVTPEIIQERTKEKVKVLSDVKVPIIHQPQQQPIKQEVTLEPSSEAEALSNVASGIATSLGLVDIVVLDDNQQYILHSNDQQLVSQQELQGGQQEFILPELATAHQYSESQEVIEHNEIGEHNVITQTMLNNSDIASTDELVMVLTDHDYGDGNNELLSNENSNIVVLYSHPVDGQESQFITSQSNLLVHSQTGMIEIRNGAAITTTAPDHLVVTRAQDTHIESIEMIQQEINSHSSTAKQEINFEGHNAVVVGSTQSASASSEEEPMQQNEIDSNQQQTEMSTGEPMDIQDKLDNDEQINLDSTLLVSKNEEDVNFSAEPKDLQNNKEILEQNLSNEEPGDILDHKMENEIEENGEDSKELNDSQEEQTTHFEADSQMNTDSHEEEQLSEEHAEENTDNNAYETASETLALDTDSLEAGNAVHSSEVEDYANQENNKSNFQSDSENTCTDSHPEEQFELQENQSTFPQQQELNPETEETEACDSSLKESEENRIEEKDDDIAVQENDASQSQMYSESNFVSGAHEQSLSPNSQNDNQQSQDENSQSQDDNSQSQDENSHCSQVSQNSSGSQQPEEYAASDMGPSTKISILDDWEDTDSQQSERSRDPKSQNTVHKLIDDDWADEDEDDSKKNSHLN